MIAGTKSVIVPLSYPGLRLQINCRAFLQAAAFMADGDIRYYLNGVHITRREAGGVYVVATDGHCMGVVAVADAVAQDLPDRGIILRASRQLLAACRGRSPLSRADMHLCVVGDRVSVAVDLDSVDGDLETFIQAGRPWVDGKFPDWRKVLPDFTTLKRTVEDDFDGKLLAKFSSIKSQSNARWGCGIRLWQSGKNNAIVVQREDIPEFVGILMPRRGADEHSNARELSGLAKEYPKPAPAGGA